MFRPRSLTLVLVSLVLAATARAGEPFETIEVGARYVANVNENEFHDYWNRGQGAELFAATPLAGGSFLAGLRYLHSNALTNDVPSFQSLFAWAGVSMGIDVTDRVRLSLGTAVGATQWFFDGEDIAGLRYELEMGTEVFAHACVGAVDGWAVTSSFIRQVTYTHERIHLSFVSVGITHTLDAPDWFRRILE